MSVVFVSGISEYNFIASKEKTLVNFECGDADVPRLEPTGENALRLMRRSSN